MAFGIPKVGDLTAQLNDKFNQLYAELQAIHTVLDNILAALTQKAPR